MTGIMVSKRDGIATAPDGTKYRVHRGKTLADERHALVQAYPADWLPMAVELTVDGDAPASTLSHAEQLQRDNDVARLEDELAEAEETAEGYRKQLAAVVELLAQRGELPLDPQLREVEGWLAVAVAGALDAPRRGVPGQVPVDEPLTIAPPKAPRKRTAGRADG